MEIGAARSFWIWVGGILLPLAALGVELYGGLCAEIFIDPIPTGWHIALIATVPLGNLAGWCGSRFKWGADKRGGWGRCAPLVSFGVALYYTVVFVPMMPIAAFGVLFLGAGLLPLSPFFSLLATRGLCVRIFPKLNGRGFLEMAGRLRWLPVMGFALVLLSDAPRLITWGFLHSLERGSILPVTQRRVVRVVGSEAMFRSAARFGTNRLLWARGWNRDEMEALRRSYYMTYGRTVDSADEQRRSRGGWDAGLGGTRVGPPVDDLFMITSRYEAEVYPENGYGYGEWMLEFRNDSEWREREARLLIGLPPGGVVSRVTLWIDDVPCEAAFGGRAEVRNAYREVAVRQRRDPLMVSWVAPGTVLAQCFPIPRRGGTMRIRLGCSFPVGRDGTVAAPQIVESNMQTDGALAPEIWIDGAETVTAQSAGPWTERALGAGKVRRILKSRELAAAWVQLPGCGPEETMGGALASYEGTVVVSLSEEDRKWVDPLAGALASYKGTGGIVIGGDPARVFESGEEAATFLRRWRPRGGVDAVPLIEAGMSRALETRTRAVWWIYGEQELSLQSTSPLERWNARGRHAMSMRATSLGYPKNRIRESVSGSRWPGDRAALRAGELVLRLTPSWLDEATLPMGAELASGPLRHRDNVVVAHALQREWSRAEMPPNDRHDWRDVATAQQLITPLTGAVVLETQAQYARHGLKAVDPDSTPTFAAIPEPAVIGFLASLLAGVLLLFGRRR